MESPPHPQAPRVARLCGLQMRSSAIHLGNPKGMKTKSHRTGDSQGSTGAPCGWDSLLPLVFHVHPYSSLYPVPVHKTCFLCRSGPKRQSATVPSAASQGSVCGQSRKYFLQPTRSCMLGGARQGPGDMLGLKKTHRKERSRREPPPPEKQPGSTLAGTGRSWDPLRGGARPWGGPRKGQVHPGHRAWASRREAEGPQMPADSEFSSHEGREALTLRTLTTAPGASEDGWLPPPHPAQGSSPGHPGVLQGP